MWRACSAPAGSEAGRDGSSPAGWSHEVVPEGWDWLPGAMLERFPNLESLKNFGVKSCSQSPRRPDRAKRRTQTVFLHVCPVLLCVVAREFDKNIFGRGEPLFDQKIAFFWSKNAICCSFVKNVLSEIFIPCPSLAWT